MKNLPSGLQAEIGGRRTIGRQKFCADTSEGRLIGLVNY